MDGCRNVGVIAGLALLLSAAQCPETVTCTLEARASLAVSVVDNAGDAVSDADVTARHVVDGAVDEVCDAIDSGGYLCPFFEVDGDFVVTARKPGFTDATATTTVGADECHVVPEQVTLTLAASDAPCCCAFIRPGDFDIISEDLAADPSACAARDQGQCIDPTGRFTPHPCCPDAVGDTCE